MAPTPECIYLLNLTDLQGRKRHLLSAGSHVTPSTRVSGFRWCPGPCVRVTWDCHGNCKHTGVLPASWTLLWLLGPACSGTFQGYCGSGAFALCPHPCCLMACPASAGLCSNLHPAHPCCLRPTSALQPHLLCPFLSLPARFLSLQGQLCLQGCQPLLGRFLLPWALGGGRWGTAPGMASLLNVDSAKKRKHLCPEWWSVAGSLPPPCIWQH